jgi:hypothetical protein
MVTGPEGRSGWALAGRLGQEQAGLVLDCVPAVHGTHLSQAMVDLDSGGWPPRNCRPRPGRPQFLAGRVPR